MKRKIKKQKVMTPMTVTGIPADKPMSDLELYMDVQNKFATREIFTQFTNPSWVQNILIILSMSQTQVDALPKEPFKSPTI